MRLGNPFRGRYGLVMTRRTIDLNADLGEGEPHDALLLGIVSSCNVACGGHTGDVSSMTNTVQLARRHGVTMGAHPSYPDREGFGRRSGFMRGPELAESLTGQISSLLDVCDGEMVELKTLKPHGALYNDARANHELAELLARLADRFGLTLIGLPGSSVQDAAEARGVAFLREGFVDRAYLADGSLCPRDRDGAVIDDVSVAAEQALRLASGQSIATADNHRLDLEIDTLCLHGDTANAVDTARAVQARLLDAGVDIESTHHD